MNGSFGPWLVGAGLALLVLGLLVWSGALSWFGRLPGDLAVERGNLRVYVPITSMVLLSLGLSALLWVLRRFLG
ncbi:MAG: DUF2905 domain-containing protein [Pseudomonadales bacterium]|jgi:hypothetical protein|nr:DUF2905 domain-containing protein [Pseudomonadales bacterium]